MKSPLIRLRPSKSPLVGICGKFLPVLGILGLCAALSACMIQGTQQSGHGGGGGGSLTVMFTPKQLTFDEEAVGTPSAAESTTVTNSATSALNITSITITGSNSSDFAETNNCGMSLDAGATCTINVIFTPSASGERIASISIADGANGSPQIAELGGVGAGSGAQTTCTGVETPQVPVDVTTQLSYVNTAAGVDVMQLSSSGCNRFYYFDIPTYSNVVNQIFYVNFISGVGNQLLAANPDGSNASVISPAKKGSQAFISPDGSLAYYAEAIVGGTPLGSDIFGGFLNSNPFQEVQITSLDLAPEPPLAVWEISSSSLDPAGGQDIAFSPDTLLHLVHVLPDGTSQIQPTITLNDPENTGTFHRIRMNPKFPNIVMYKRNAATNNTGASPELWLVDLNTCSGGTCSAANIVNVVQNLPLPTGIIPKAGHVIWSPDGLDIAFQEPDIADFWLATNVVTPTGTLNLTAGEIPTSNLKELGPYTGMTADYCAFPPDWPTATVLACVAGPASNLNPKDLYLMSTDSVGTTKLLSSTDALVLTINGTPMPIFAQDDQHILFNSDKTGSVQVYLVSGFTLTVP
jgi:hypothetical protein